MKTRIISSISIFTLFTCLFIPNSNAVWMGESPVNDTRSVPLLFSPTETWCSSAWAYSSRIIFTAAHSLFEGNDIDKEQTVIRQNVWIGYPGETVSFMSNRIRSEKIFISNYVGRSLWPWSTGSTITRTNDFAVIVLEKPLPIDNKPVELLTPELHNKYIESGEYIESTGYGAQKAEELRQRCDNRKPMKYSSKIIGKNVYPNGFIYTAMLNFNVGVGKPNLCDGDSGAGYVKEFSDKYVYLGAAGAGSWMNHNCETWDEARYKETINGSDPVYLFLDLIKQAEDYVKANPYIEVKKAKKILFSCINKNTIKQFKKYKKKCPKGYKIL